MSVSPFVVEQHDTEHLVIDEAAQQVADLGQQRIEIEDRGEFGGDFVEHGQRLRLAGDARIKPRIFDGLRDARCGEGEQVQVLGTEIAGLLALEVHHADEAVLGDQRHREFGAHIGIGRDVALRRRRRR